MTDPSVTTAALPVRHLQQLFHTESTVCDVAPTLCALWGLPAPAACQGEPIARVLAAAAGKLPAGARLQRTLLFCPDAIGDVLHQDFPQDFAALAGQADVKVSCTTVLPSVTPVCFGSIFTGAMPDVHGIQAYSKPVLSVPTLYDVFHQAGLRIASIAVNNCSLDKILRDRHVTYISTRSNAESFAWAETLLARDEHDLILCYDGGYDSSIHRHGCQAPESLQKMRLSLQRFAALAELADRCWQGYHRLLTFTPDHGCHDNPESGKGTHGTDAYDDIVLNHYYRIAAAR